MIPFDPSDIRRIAIAPLGTLLLSAACLTGAVAPAGAAPAVAPAPAPAAPTVAAWQTTVGEQLDAALVLPAGMADARRPIAAAIEVSFDRAGAFTGAAMAQPSGSAAVDRHMLRIAARIAYPPLPRRFRGRPQTVTVQAYFVPAGATAAAGRDLSPAPTRA